MPIEGVRIKYKIELLPFDALTKSDHALIIYSPLHKIAIMRPRTVCLSSVGS